MFHSVNDIEICDPIENRKYALLRILSFDIETHVPHADSSQVIQPNAQVDPVLQIGCMVANYGMVKSYQI